MGIYCRKLSYQNINESLIKESVSSELKCVVIIPAFSEESIIPTLSSLQQNQIDERKVEIIVLINESVSIDHQDKMTNRKCFDELKDYDSSNLNVHVVYVFDIPDKIAGVGTARKLAMDEAAARLKSSNNFQEGIIVNLDADCKVSPNYCASIISFFKENQKVELANIHFEHKLEECKNQQEKDAIIQYELHLRYFIAMQCWLELPYSVQTVGSAFAVKAAAYKNIGGMNRRKAGEDFYFIHKFTKKGTARNLNSCCVYPSGRPSFRVPFGTGRAVADYLENPDFKTYNPDSFKGLQSLVSIVNKLYSNPQFNWKDEIAYPVRAYLDKQNIDDVLAKLKGNSRSFQTFKKAFYQWFDAFRLMKYLHYARDNYYPNLSLIKAIRLAKTELKIEEFSESDEDLLILLRKRHISQH